MSWTSQGRCQCPADHAAPSPTPTPDVYRCLRRSPGKAYRESLGWHEFALLYNATRTQRDTASPTGFTTATTPGLLDIHTQRRHANNPATTTNHRHHYQRDIASGTPVHNPRYESRSSRSACGVKPITDASFFMSKRRTASIICTASAPPGVAGSRNTTQSHTTPKEATQSRAPRRLVGPSLANYP